MSVVLIQYFATYMIRIYVINGNVYSEIEGMSEIENE